MTHRFSAVYLIVVVAIAAAWPVAAQGPRMTPDRLAALAKKLGWISKITYADGHHVQLGRD